MKHKLPIFLFLFSGMYVSSIKTHYNSIAVADEKKPSNFLIFKNEKSYFADLAKKKKNITGNEVIDYQHIF